LNSKRLILILFACLTLLVVVATGVTATPQIDMDPDEIQDLIVEWNTLTQNVSAPPKKYAYQLTELGDAEREAIALDKRAEIESKMNDLWTSSSSQGRNIHRNWQSRLEEALDFPDHRELGGKVKDISIKNIKINNDEAIVDAEMVIVWAIMWKNPNVFITVSEEKVIDRYVLRWDEGKWRIESWELLSLGASAEIIHREELDSDLAAIPDEVLGRFGL